MIWGSKNTLSFQEHKYVVWAYAHTIGALTLIFHCTDYHFHVILEHEELYGSSGKRHAMIVTDFLDCKFPDCWNGCVGPTYG
jgi:hypothetical protein